MPDKRKRSVAVDFDGVIHRYSKGWRDGTIYDPPIDGAVDALARLHRRYRVVIFTTRVSDAMRDGVMQREAIIAWLQRYGLRRGEHWDEITATKPPALVYIDDRGLHFTAWDDALLQFAARYTLD